MSPSIARKALLLLSISHVDQEHESKENISSLLFDRECEVLKLVIEGKGYRAIAEKLILSTHTIRKHIYYKLHVSSKAQAINLALQGKWFKNNQ